MKHVNECLPGGLQGRGPSSHTIEIPLKNLSKTRKHSKGGEPTTH
jgi:hypothetical protein